MKAERHQWAAAMKRAAGEKVLDDPKLLKRSLKREAKRKEKSAATWAQKEKEQKEARDVKQNKRQTNLKVCLACPPPHVSVLFTFCRCVGARQLPTSPPGASGTLTRWRWLGVATGAQGSGQVTTAREARQEAAAAGV